MKRQPDERGRLGRILFKLFDHWQITNPQRLILLGLNPESPIDPNEYLSRGSFAADRDKLERASILLGIHKSLRVLFPANRDLVYQWISHPNNHFDGMTPVEIVERHGIPGMHMVRGYLDQQLAGQDLAAGKQIKARAKISLAPDEESIEWLSATTTCNESPDFVFETSTEGILQLLDVWTLALSIFSRKEKARLWLVTHAPALGCAPVAILATKSGRTKVLGVLRRIEQGDFGG
ncbi:hypothetical protein AUP74_00674 [Microbulbifer aggregans]|uniref:Antitoxin Xre/MbcA/ParS-like toxin-binding domain-containing protein n=1 Tax=Microbulbifer aggregans TaxID=1769779 RepID=A0A1C9W4S2_9GAMM|nr:antitoxin Xre/MbcA/ParS toxin-binding domain-containing protein [Microbulbifer aggregans]AOS96143.1 hypothetical protein AUP74_00674 [Microbulbifer aggregans]